MQTNPISERLFLKPLCKRGKQLSRRVGYYSSLSLSQLSYIPLALLDSYPQIDLFMWRSLIGWQHWGEAFFPPTYFHLYTLSRQWTEITLISVASPTSCLPSPGSKRGAVMIDLAVFLPPWDSSVQSLLLLCSFWNSDFQQCIDQNRSSFVACMSEKK